MLNKYNLAMRKILWAAFAAVILVAGILYLNLDRLVKAAIETYGPRLTQTTVKVGRVNLSPFSGRGRIRNLEIGSPRGFNEPYVFRLADIRIRLVPKSLASDRMVIEEIALVGPEVRYETGPNGSNFARIQRNIDAFLPPPSKGGAPSKPKKVRIDHFSARDGKVYANLYGVKASLPLPDVTLEHIGSDEGTSIQDAVKRILSALSSSAMSAIAQGGKGLKEGAQSAAGAVSKTLKGLFK